MPYTVDPTNPLSPTNLDGATQGAEEFRALKGYIAGLAIGALNPFSDRIINGNFALDQRNCGVALSISTAAIIYGPDRWFGFGTAASGVFTIRRIVDALYPGEFRFQVDVTTADAALAVGDLYLIGQRVEGINCGDLQMGLAGAKQITVAFEIESELTGVFPISFINSALNRSYVTTFTINAANTREVKTITITLDTAGAWLVDTGVGLQVSIGLGVGTTFQAAAPDIWSAGQFFTVAGCTNFMTPVNNTMYIKNFRMYRGNADLGINQRLFAIEELLCKRYYEKSFNMDTVPTTGSAAGYMFCGDQNNVPNASIFGELRFKIEKRVAPSVTIRPFVTPTNTGRVSNAGSTDQGPGSGSAINIGTGGCAVQNGSGGAITTSSGGFIYHYEASAEL